jgi:DNA-directed RNA polymerase specialized sigma24 family protein
VTEPFSAQISSEQWTALRTLMLTKARYRLQSSPPEVIEDVVHDALYEVARYIHRVGLPKKLDAFAATVVRRRCFDRIDHNRVRRNTVNVEDFGEVLAEARATEWLSDLEEEVALQAQRVVEYFRARASGCLELAQVKMADIEFKAHAELTRQSYDAIRKRWSRCLESFNSALREGDALLEGLPGWKGGDS